MNDMSPPVLSITHLNVYYGKALALRDINMSILPNQVTALIGPSGCGKSTFLRCLNRMNDTIKSARVEGEILFEGEDIYHPETDLANLRQRIGMVFQKPNPFPKSIYDNVAFGPRVTDMGIKKGELDDLVEDCLRRAALWDDVSEMLYDDAMNLSLGQQQRLCIARVLAVQPDVILMDEPASALDPIATEAIEELIATLKKDYTIVIVTHNMQQAGRVSDFTGLFWLGELVEFSPTTQMFTNPKEKISEDYITGRMG